MRTRLRTRVFGSTGTHGYVFTGTHFTLFYVPVAYPPRVRLRVRTGTFFGSTGTHGYVFFTVRFLRTRRRYVYEYVYGYVYGYVFKKTYPSLVRFFLDLCETFLRTRHRYICVPVAGTFTGTFWTHFVGAFETF